MWLVLEPLTLHHLSPHFTVLVPAGETLSSLRWRGSNLLAAYRGEAFALPSGSLHKLRLVGREEPIAESRKAVNCCEGEEDATLRI